MLVFQYKHMFFSLNIRFFSVYSSVYSPYLQGDLHVVAGGVVAQEVLPLLVVVQAEQVRYHPHLLHNVQVDMTVDH